MLEKWFEAIHTSVNNAKAAGDEIGGRAIDGERPGDIGVDRRRRGLAAGAGERCGRQHRTAHQRRRPSVSMSFL